MILALLAYLGGVLTIVSPCVLPVLPFIFARAEQPFLRNGLPMLVGMAATFALVATLASVGGGWAVAANEYGRIAALVLLTLFGLALLFPAVSDQMTRPFVAMGARLSKAAEQDTPNILSSLLLGAATGLLWTPCTGPILGLILTGAAIEGPNVHSTLLLAAFAAGAATSLAVALLAGGRVFAAMRRSIGAGQWIRRGLGAVVIAMVAVIALGLDTSLLSSSSQINTTSLEQSLVNWLTPSRASSSATPDTSKESDRGKEQADTTNLPTLGTFPELSGATDWLNSPPLTPAGLKGKVVLVDFWTYSCINCLREIPYIEAWAQKYKDEGLVVIGVHTPEFAFEMNVDNVKKAVANLKITYPVAIDNNYAIWRAFENEYWPALYFIDANGFIRNQHFGEGNYDESERVIQELLAAAGKNQVSKGLVSVDASGVEAASDMGDDQSPETYIGYDRAENFVSPGGAIHDAPHAYTAGDPGLNEWGLSGVWTDDGQYAQLAAGTGGITYRFHARDLHLVLGPGPDGKPVRFHVTIDGAPPGDNHGADDNANGDGTVTGERLYQLVRQTGAVKDHTFEIQFLDPGVQAYAFTFG